MRRLFILFIIWLLPLQPLLAADVEFAHLVGSQSSQEKTLTHMVEHMAHIAHHHEQDGDLHQDDSVPSVLHLIDFEHNIHLSTLLADEVLMTASRSATEVPGFVPVIYLNPSASPPQKPPYLAL
ncbi:MAG: hypothetical protein ACTS9Y_14910 [Methylophilus sp.]|uniref:hypothetical protein n=1 Tax=Methylophilus sp. TaxID=29541 RepID=UPI003F9F94F3